MQINNAKKIITLHLEGMPLRNIGDEMGISKDTVGSVIEKWKNGNISHNFFQKKFKDIKKEITGGISIFYH